MSTTLTPVKPNDNYPKNKNGVPMAISFSAIRWSRLIRLIIQAKHNMTLPEILKSRLEHEKDSNFIKRFENIFNLPPVVFDIIKDHFYDQQFEKFEYTEYARISSKESIQFADLLAKGVHLPATSSDADFLLEMEPFWRNSGGFYKSKP